MNVYVVSSAGQMCKIGIARDPKARLGNLVTGHPFRLELAGSFQVEASLARHIEHVAHSLLASKKMTGEWFDVTPVEAIEAVRKAIENPHLLGRAPERPYSAAERQRAFRERQAARLAQLGQAQQALHRIVERLAGNDKPLATEITEIARAGLAGHG